jgi:hypothetical protein
LQNQKFFFNYQTKSILDITILKIHNVIINR